MRSPATHLPGAEAGQATVELAGFLPVLAAVALAAFTVLAAQSAGEHAGQAAEAAAVALIQDRDPRAAARDAIPAATRRRTRVTIAARRVTVHVRPSVPLLAAHLEASATADAGPEPAP